MVWPNLKTLQANCPNVSINSSPAGPNDSTRTLYKANQTLEAQYADLPSYSHRSFVHAALSKIRGFITRLLGLAGETRWRYTFNFAIARLKAIFSPDQMRTVSYIKLLALRSSPETHTHIIKTYVIITHRRRRERDVRG